MTARRTKGGKAVTESVARGEVESDTPEQRLHRQLNFFPSPPWTGRVAAELIRAVDPWPRDFPWRLQEPACGEGHLAAPLRETFRDVRASDIHPFGFGSVADYLAADWGGPMVDWTVTNPPFAHAEAFLQRGLETSRRGVALLCRLAFLETAGRYQLMRRVTLVAPFAERVGMQLGVWLPDGGAMTAFAWFIWMTPQAEQQSPLWPAIDAARCAGGNLTIITPPGTKARLSRPEDLRFTPQAAAPLFEGVQP